MEHPFFTPAGPLRWLAIAEKLLSARDLLGSKSFATRARDSDPTLSPADEILAVVDTLLAGDKRIGNNQPDWYAILRLTQQQGRDGDLVAAQYRRLVHLLNPQTNRFPFSEQAFRLVFEAWSVLTNPSRKSLYDKELSFYLQPQQYQHESAPFNDPITTLPQNFIFFGGGGTASSVAPPQLHGGQSSSIGVSSYGQIQQVHSQVEPILGGSTREPQNFMNFSSSPNFLFGSDSGSKSIDEPADNQAQESRYYSTFAGNVASASAPNQEQLNIKQKQSEQDTVNVSDKAFDHDMNVSENVSETIEGEEDEERVDFEEEVEIVDSAINKDDGTTIWTTCPYCYYMYEYPRMYADCTLRCQHCKKAFQAVIIPSPPPSVDGQEAYFCCWGFLPFGFSMENWKKNKGASSSWTPFSSSSMFNHPQRIVNKRVVNDDEDEDFVEISSSNESDDDWQSTRNKTKKKKKKKKARNIKRKKTSDINVKNVSSQDMTIGEPSKLEEVANERKPPGRVEKLDLNVEFSNSEAEEAVVGRGEDDNIGFFEGLDEFLNSLPILNVVGDDKVVKAA